MYSYKLRDIDSKGPALFIKIQDVDFAIFTDTFLNAIALLNPEFVLQNKEASAVSELPQRFKTILGECTIYFNLDEAIIRSDREELVLMIDSRLMINPIFDKID
jgi:hypothetical protein